MTNTFFSSWWKTLSVFLDPTRKRFCALLVFCNDCIHGMFLYDVKYSIFKWICLSMSALKHLAVYLKTCVFCEFEILKAVNIVCFFLSVKAGHQYLSFSLSLCFAVCVLPQSCKKKKSCCLLVVFCSYCLWCNFPSLENHFLTEHFPLPWPIFLQWVYCDFSLSIYSIYLSVSFQM